MTEIISNILMIFAIFFTIASLLGYLRMKSFLSRAHASGIFDSCGMAMFLFAIMVRNGMNLWSAKIFLLFIIIMLTSPTACHVICKFSLSDQKCQ